jgi:hypothetical protein
MRCIDANDRSETRQSKPRRAPSVRRNRKANSSKISRIVAKKMIKSLNRLPDGNIMNIMTHDEKPCI